MTTVRNGVPVTAADGELAALSELAELLEPDPDRLPRLVGADGGEMEVPASVASVLRRVVKLLAEGHAVAVEPLDRELTTQQAAGILNVSRPYLVRLLDRGDIPWTRTGTHRRVRLQDLLLYKQRRDAERRAALRELTQLSDKLGLYGRPPDPEAAR